MAMNEAFFNATLAAKKGPLGTSDYHISVAAIPLSESSTFFHLGYEYKTGFLTRIAMSTYLSTLARNKVGFTIKEYDENEQPVYIDGIRGVIERNAVRYYFAILSFLNAEAAENSLRFERRISQWFDLTEGYHRQLYEMDKNEYLKYKKMERQDQLRLQKDIDETATSEQDNMVTNIRCIDLQ